MITESLRSNVRRVKKNVSHEKEKRIFKLALKQSTLKSSILYEI